MTEYDRPTEINDLISGNTMKLSSETTINDVFEWFMRPEVWGRDIDVCPDLKNDALGWSERALRRFEDLEPSEMYSEYQGIALS